MEDLGFNGCQPCINNPEEFWFFLNQSVDPRGWLIAMYHAIGWDGVRHRLGWGYYNLENFYKEMPLAKSFRDKGLLWIASMDDVTLYTMERNATTWRLEPKNKWVIDFHLVNNLDKTRFNHKLTLSLLFPRATGKRFRITAFGSTTPIVDTLLRSHELLVDLAPAEKPYTFSIY